MSGAKGCFQVGVLKRLTEQGIIPNEIYGTSVGALNAAGYCFAGIDKLEEVWTSITGKKDIVSFQLTSLAFSTKGLYSTGPLRSLVSRIVDEQTVPQITPTVCITHIETGECVYLTPWNATTRGMTFTDAVVASASMPFIMEPVNDIWVDGGIRDTIPLNAAIQNGATEVYVIACNPWTRNLPVKETTKNWMDVAMATIDIFVHEVYINDVQGCLKNNNRPDKRFIKVHLFAPDEVFIDTLDFSPEAIALGIEKGYMSEEISHDFVRSI